MLKRLALLLLLLPLSTGIPARGTYQEPDAFLADVFAGEVPEPSVVWLTGERKKTVQQLLGHRYPSLRVRYWRRDRRSAWILEEVGKEQPITVGVVVNDGRLEKIRVLTFRESRGEEIRHPFFTDQFQDAGLDDKGHLDRTIDGISGATLSVRAMKKLARLALYLDAETSKADVAPPP
ncbi:MAG TPA: FMN-binding protein [Gammaproteobacteria bacterium]|nr:FMN-binding protein [Gammaproteobacteria bacterium]